MEQVPKNGINGKTSARLYSLSSGPLELFSSPMSVDKVQVPCMKKNLSLSSVLHGNRHLLNPDLEPDPRNLVNFFIVLSFCELYFALLDSEPDS
jgi:hypothetical protein